MTFEKPAEKAASGLSHPFDGQPHLGGGKCTNTIVMVYQQPDDVTMRASLSRRSTIKSLATGMG